MDIKNLITAKEASKILKISLRQTNHLVHAGKLSVALGELGRGKKIYLDRNEVKEFAKIKRQVGRPKVKRGNDEKR